MMIHIYYEDLDGNSYRAPAVNYCRKNIHLTCGSLPRSTSKVHVQY